MTALKKTTGVNLSRKPSRIIFKFRWRRPQRPFSTPCPDPEATTLFVDGISAYDSISRVAGPQTDGRGRCFLAIRESRSMVLLPPISGKTTKGLFTKCFREKGENRRTHSCQPRDVLSSSVSHHSRSTKGREGEQGDPFMLMLFSLGWHRALEAVQRRLCFAYLDDVVFVCRPDRVAEVEAVIREELRRHAHVDVHQGKTQVWNWPSW